MLCHNSTVRSHVTSPNKILPLPHSLRYTVRYARTHNINLPPDEAALRAFAHDVVCMWPERGQFSDSECRLFQWSGAETYKYSIPNSILAIARFVAVRGDGNGLDDSTRLADAVTQSSQCVVSRASRVAVRSLFVAYHFACILQLCE
jgi:hypothetical protein